MNKRDIKYTEDIQEHFKDLLGGKIHNILEPELDDNLNFWPNQETNLINTSLILLH